LRGAADEARAEPDIALVIITGDIAETGLPSEFGYAHDFLRSLADELSLSSDRFVMLPGNHDISWDDCQIVRSGLRGEKFPPEEFDRRLNTEKLRNFRQFLAAFYGGTVTDGDLSSIPDTRPLDCGGWLREFPKLRLSVAALNTSERENDSLKGGYLSINQAQSLMNRWRETDAANKIKIIALHHNPIATTPTNTKWTIDWLRTEEQKGNVRKPMSGDLFARYIGDLAGFEGREHLSRIVRDTAAHLVLHGHHHDQGEPILWPWAQNGSAPVLSVGSFGLDEKHLPGQAPLSCQLIRLVTEGSPRLVAIPLVYDGRFRLEGHLLEGAFRVEPHSRSRYDQPLPLPSAWQGAELPVPQRVGIEPTRARSSSIPQPPDLYAYPPYIGSHEFVGRQAQLDILSDWALAADSHAVLLFEAIGGSGKSLLTWEWTTKHATEVRDDWAGRFWYSFYEKGATMGDFCRRALAYMTGRSVERLRDRNLAELTPSLLHELRRRPWLLVLDGLERVLVAYHRFDAAQAPDDTAGTGDEIGRRDPCAAITPEDDDLLRVLTSAQPSKILLTSRLIPRALLNQSNQPIPGAIHERLPGLRPTEAETLIRACGVTGTSTKIQKYLKVNCDCHPLVIGVLAGLIVDYLPARGDFDAWVDDPTGGGQLNLAALDLVQKRNHILGAALAALPKKGRELLSTLALLSEPVDYMTLSALNPFLPPVPEEPIVPRDPRLATSWRSRSEANMTTSLKKYEDALLRRQHYDHVIAQRKLLSATAPAELQNTVHDLERRGLLQYDRVTKRHDLHPVVRAVSAGGLKQEEKDQLGQRVVDHFSQQAENPYEQAQSLEDFGNARRIVNALFHMGNLKRAKDFIESSGFLGTMLFRLEAHNEALAIMRPFFTEGWSDIPPILQVGGRSIVRRAAVSLRRLDQLDDAFAIMEADLRFVLSSGAVNRVSYRHFLDLSNTAGDQYRFGLEDRLIGFADDWVSIVPHADDRFAIELARFRQLSRLGRWNEVDALWPRLDATTEARRRAIVSHHRAVSLHLRGALTEDELRQAEELNRRVESALGRRNLCALRGWWLSDAEEWAAARDSLSEAVALAHKAGKADRRSESRLALARYCLGEDVQVQEISDQPSYIADIHTYLPLARLWLEAGNIEKTEELAIKTYKHAWADGAPYSHWYECARAREILDKIGAKVPILPPFNAAQSPILAWESHVARVIAERRDKISQTDRPLD
jgi:hypothetical protein